MPQTPVICISTIISIINNMITTTTATTPTAINNNNNIVDLLIGILLIVGEEGKWGEYHSELRLSLNIHLIIHP